MRSFYSAKTCKKHAKQLNNTKSYKMFHYSLTTQSSKSCPTMSNGQECKFLEAGTWFSHELVPLEQNLGIFSCSHVESWKAEVMLQGSRYWEGTLPLGIGKYYVKWYHYTFVTRLFLVCMLRIVDSGSTTLKMLPRGWAQGTKGKVKWSEHGLLQECIFKGKGEEINSSLLLYWNPDNRCINPYGIGLWPSLYGNTVTWYVWIYPWI